MSDRISIDLAMLEQIVQQANRRGRQGEVIVGVVIVPATTAAGQDSYALIPQYAITPSSGM